MSVLLDHAKNLLFACAMGLATTSWATTTIDTISAWDGATSISSFGTSGTATYGQVITVPAGETTLDSFTFYMRLPTTVAFRGSVFAWDATTQRATGSSLYESPVMSTTQGAAFEAVTFTIPGGVAVTPGQQYVIFASTSQDQAGHSGAGPWGLIASDPYAGGKFVYMNNGSSTAGWTTNSWTTWSSTSDLAFTAVFGAASPPVNPAAIPALSEWLLALMTLVLGSIAVVTLRRSG